MLFARVMVALGVVALIGGALRLALHGVRRRSVISAIGWSAVAVAPFVAFFGTQAMIDARVAARAKQLGTLPTEKLGGVYPRTLEVHGELGETILAALVGSGLFDEAYQLPERRNWFGDAERITVSSSPACRALAKSALDQIEADGNPSSTDRSALAECTTREPLDRSSSPPAADAVVMLMDFATTLHLGNTLTPNSALEVRVRRGGSDKLVYYWERPYVVRPVSPFSLKPLGFTAPDDPKGPPVNPTTLLVAALER